MMKDFLFYLQLGWEHIISMDALDHQLFILALVAAYSFKDFKRMLMLVTAFTIGHCITLALSSFDIVHIKSSWVEFLIPCTIVIAAIDNILLRGKHFYQYYLVLFFGLVHGMGFANSARMMLAKEQSITIPLLGFNVGLELGQIAMVLLILLIYTVLSKITKMNQREWLLITSSVAGTVALQMAIERFPLGS